MANGRNNWGARQTVQPRVPARVNKASKPLTVKSVGVEAGETPGFTGEFVGETHRVLEHTQNHPPENQDQKGPICLWVVGEVPESGERAKQVALVHVWPLPQVQHHNAATWVALPWRIPEAPPLTM